MVSSSHKLTWLLCEQALCPLSHFPNPLHEYLKHHCSPCELALWRWGLEAISYLSYCCDKILHKNNVWKELVVLVTVCGYSSPWQGRQGSRAVRQLDRLLENRQMMLPFIHS